MFKCKMCGKKVTKGLDYCSSECVLKAQELDEKSKANEIMKLNKTEEELILIDKTKTKKTAVYNNGGKDIWVGQSKRRMMTNTIMDIAKELLPCAYKEFACQVADRTGISLRKITDDYLEILRYVNKIVINDNGIVTLGEVKNE